MCGIQAEFRDLYVVAEVTKREAGKAVDFEALLKTSNYDIATALSGRYADRDVIIIPPFGTKENPDIAPGEVAGFLNAFYG